MNLSEFEKWALAQKSVGNPTEEGSYKGECVSLVQQYLKKVHGLEFKARGNAKDWVNADIEGFNRFDNKNYILPGDILVYNYGTYGHIVIVTKDKKSLEQNKNGNKTIIINEVSGNFAMILRPNYVDLGIESFKVRVDKEKAVVRKEPRTQSASVKQPSGRDYLIKGIIFECIEIVKGQDPYNNGNNNWYKSKKGNYIWSGGLTKL